MDVFNIDIDIETLILHSLLECVCLLICSSYLEYATLLPLDLSMFLIGRLMQTVPLICEHIHVVIGKPRVDLLR